VSNRLLWALVACLVVVVAACGGTDTQSGGATTSPAVGAASFPVTVASGDETLELEKPPQRIISLSPSATESLFAIGAGPQVEAVDDQSTYPADAPRTKLSGFEPNLEAIARYRPDLVVVGFDPGSLVDGLERLRIPVLLQPAPSDLEGAYDEIAALGTATGHADEAEQLVADMRERLDDLAASTRDEGLSVYHELGPDYFSATSKTFIGSVYQLLGLENIADGAGGGASDYPQLSAEYILDSDPDLIVLSDTKCCAQSLETVARRPGWKQLTAVRRGDVVPVDDDIASRWGPRVVEFAEIVAGAVEETSGS
jgi:iron complex transport system substrate-binding protein